MVPDTPSPFFIMVHNSKLPQILTHRDWISWCSAALLCRKVGEWWHKSALLLVLLPSLTFSLNRRAPSFWEILFFSLGIRTYTVCSKLVKKRKGEIFESLLFSRVHERNHGKMGLLRREYWTSRAGWATAHDFLRGWFCTGHPNEEGEWPLLLWIRRIRSSRLGAGGDRSSWRPRGRKSSNNGEPQQQ